ncbi:MAG: dicarboxylate/amino acid:cation symporter [Planctomycetota bacterium]
MKAKDHLLTVLILAGLVGGILVGQLLLFNPNASAEAIAQTVQPWNDIGDLIFIRPLRMMIIPLVFISVVVGVTSIGDPQKLGLVGGATLLFYVTTMLLAVILGLTIVNTIKPGAGIDPSQFESAGQAAFETKRVAIESGSAEGIGGAFMNLLYQMVPTNPITAAVEGNTLGVVVFSILLGLALVMSGEPARPVIRVFEGLFEALIKLVTWIIWIAPIGVFLLVAGRVGETGLSSLAGPIGLYALCVLLGLAIHAMVTLPAVLLAFGRTNPFRYMWQMRKPILTAFSTASSSATLPITIEEAEKSGGCSKKAANFVLPLGATVNMDGTALYQAVAVVFLFQMFGLDLTLTQQLVILITATLAAIGAAGIPSAGLVTMAIVITAVNRSLGTVEGAEQLPMWTIGIILGVDRILDMCRTAVNVWGDATGARILTRFAPDDDDAPAAT